MRRLHSGGDLFRMAEAFLFRGEGFLLPGPELRLFQFLKAFLQRFHPVLLFLIFPDEPPVLTVIGDERLIRLVHP